MEHNQHKNLTETQNDYAVFLPALSTFYALFIGRQRRGLEPYNEDKKAAYQTLCECLLTVAKLGSPIAPFYFEQAFANINGVIKKESVNSIHLSSFPVANDLCIDLNLESRMGYAQRIASLVHALRKGEQLKVRQPLSKILIPVLSENIQTYLLKS